MSAKTQSTPKSFARCQEFPEVLETYTLSENPSFAEFFRFWRHCRNLSGVVVTSIRPSMVESELVQHLSRHCATSDFDQIGEELKDADSSKGRVFELRQKLERKDILLCQNTNAALQCASGTGKLLFDRLSKSKSAAHGRKLVVLDTEADKFDMLRFLGKSKVYFQPIEFIEKKDLSAAREIAQDFRSQLDTFLSTAPFESESDVRAFEELLNATKLSVRDINRPEFYRGLSNVEISKAVLENHTKPRDQWERPQDDRPRLNNYDLSPMQILLKIAELVDSAELPPVPAEPLVKFRGKPRDGNPLIFVIRHYGVWLAHDALDQATLRRIDERLLSSVWTYLLKNNELPAVTEFIPAAVRKK